MEIKSTLTGDLLALELRVQEQEPLISPPKPTARSLELAQANGEMTTPPRRCRRSRARALARGTGGGL